MGFPAAEKPRGIVGAAEWACFVLNLGSLMLTWPAIILVALGLLLIVIGAIWAIVVAFRRSLVWGLCYLFVPFAALVFVFVAWADVKRAFFVNVIGVLMMAAVLLLPNQGGLGLTKLIPLELHQLAPLPVTLPNALIQVSTEDRMAELATREQSLRARKAALDPKDEAGARALTEEILKYNADLKAVTDEQEAARVKAAPVVGYNPAPQ